MLPSMPRRSCLARAPQHVAGGVRRLLGGCVLTGFGAEAFGKAASPPNPHGRTRATFGHGDRRPHEERRRKGRARRRPLSLHPNEKKKHGPPARRTKGTYRA